MSKKFQQLQKIRSWSIEQVLNILVQHGLSDCCEGVRKREVDGDILLTLTEGQLALWRDVNTNVKKQLLRFIEDLKNQPEKYTEPCQMEMPSITNNSGRNTPSFDSASWGSDFSDDKPEELGDIMQKIPAQPPLPFRPPKPGPKPNNLTKPPDLPKPPDLLKPPLPPLPPAESNNYGHVKDIVSGLNLPEHHDMYDDDEYESLNSDTIASNRETMAALLQKKLDAHPPAMEEHYEEYESIREKENGGLVLPTGDGTDYYLQPIQPKSKGTLPVPDKTWPATKPPSPPQRQSDEGSTHTSPGNSGDGVTGLLGEIFRRIRGPDTKSTVAGQLAQNLLTRVCTEMADMAVGMKRRILYPIRRLLSRYDDVLPPEDQERIPTPEVLKPPTLSTSSPKLLPPEPRPIAVNSHRPLPAPPGSQGAKLHRTSKVELTQQPWYHNVDRKRSEEMLKNGEDGYFLVRPSSHAQNALTLTLWYNRRLYNIGIRQRPDGLYALGTEKPKEQSFSSVEELIHNYHHESLVLYSGGEKTGQAKLTTSPSQLQ